MKKTFLLFILGLLLASYGVKAQSTRYYVTYRECFCDTEKSRFDNTAKPAYHFFISNVQSAPARSVNGTDNDSNKAKVRDRFRDQVKIEYKNWVDFADSNVSDFNTETEAADFRRKKMAEAKSDPARKYELHKVDF